LDGDDRFKLWNWIKAMEQRLPQPNVVIVLNVPVELSKKTYENREMKNEMEGGEDIHEADLSYQEKVRKTYIEIAKKENWLIIDCFEERGDKIQFRKIEEIHEEIYKKLRDII